MLLNLRIKKRVLIGVTKAQHLYQQKKKIKQNRFKVKVQNLSQNAWFYCLWCLKSSIAFNPSTQKWVWQKSKCTLLITWFITWFHSREKNFFLYWSGVPPHPNFSLKKTFIKFIFSWGHKFILTYGINLIYFFLSKNLSIKP